MTSKVFLICFVVFTAFLVQVECLECLRCQNVEDPKHCNTTILCQNGQSCYVKTTQSAPTVLFELGCENNQQCGTGSPAASIVGKREVSASMVGKRQTFSCHECCSANNCNEQLCAHRKPSACIDSETVDCALMHSLFNVCADIQHAKSVCPKFCGLCTLVDGNWANWGAWSTCDVTCENGTQVRMRTCTNPVPKNGGLNCTGQDRQIRMCSKDLCPVHGGWSGWSDWGTCSATCDVGMSQRWRACTNPKPALAGDFCLGAQQEYKMCTASPCSTWMDWGSWTSCSVTCGAGLQRRYRNCTSTSSILGIGCVGSNDQTETCSNSTCDQVAFNAHGHQALAGNIITFTTVILNEGNAFNKTSGLFTAPFSGNYFFSVQLCAQNQQSILFNIKKANADMSSPTYLTSAHDYDHNSYLCGTSFVVTKLHVGDHVWVYTISSARFLYDSGTQQWCSFTGSLLSVSD
ncbi:thrombospondin-1-like [Mya arenaria]|uniref:thrombospondin-1-like n=1 Tax=Mya arenaria TaxID=6604 RepID=UPI0022DEE26B|nr:thrombospondin-1-like [Mya arenaria]